MVIDDPVSSLDHIRRERVARRLIEEAKKRQVIVLTHDMMLYTDVEAQATEHQVPLSRCLLRRVPEGYGYVEDGLAPWQARTVAQRLHVLEHTHLPELRTLHEDKDLSYRERSRGFGELLRETWERLIEEQLFGNVVVRFRPSVDTLRLSGAIFDVASHALETDQVRGLFTQRRTPSFCAPFLDSASAST